LLHGYLSLAIKKSKCSRQFLHHPTLPELFSSVQYLVGAFFFGDQ
jgi:hypothetical protein